MSASYLFGTYRYGDIGGQGGYFWAAVTGATGTISDTGLDAARYAALLDWAAATLPGVSPAQMLNNGTWTLVNSGDLAAGTWSVILPDPIPGDPLDPGTGAPGNAPGPGIGGPWTGGLGGNGPDGSPAPPPPPPRPGGGCKGMTYLLLFGLPVTTAVYESQWLSDGSFFPGCNGMEAHAKLWTLQYPENEAGTGLDYSKPPARHLQWDRGHAPDGTILWSGSGIQWSLVLELEMLPVEVDGIRYEPEQRYYPVGTGCMEVGLPVKYRALPGPGLLRDPIRVQLGEDQSGLFRDNRVSLTYPADAAVTLGTPYRIGLETDPAHGVMSFELASRSHDETTGLVDWTGETILGRLSREYPFPGGLFAKGPFTPKEALETLLMRMRQPEGIAEPLREWLGWEALPDLYLRGDGGPILPILEGLIIEEPTDGPGPSAQDVLRQFFEPFAGYAFRASRWGRLEVITPPWHPRRSAGLTASRIGPGTVDAAVAWALPVGGLTWTLTSSGSGGALPSGSSDLTGDWQVLAEQTEDYRLSARLSGGQAQLQLEVLGGEATRVMRATGVIVDPEEVRDPALALTLADLEPGGTRVLDESNVVNVCTVTSQGYTWADGAQVLPPAVLYVNGEPTDMDPHPEATLQPGQLWEVPPELIVAGGSITVTLNAVGDTPAVLGGRKGMRTKEDRTASLPAVDGASVDVRLDGWPYASLIGNLLILRLTYVGQGRGAVRITPVRLDRGDARWAVSMTATGTAYTKSSVKVSATYGEGETSPDLAASRAGYGRRERTLNTGVYQVNTATALSMARAVVRERLNPREVITYPQAPPYLVRPEHVGRLIDVPGWRGQVTGWSYDEAHTPQDSRSSSQFTLTAEQRLVLLPLPLPGGDTLNVATERRYHRARWGAARF